MLSKSRRFSRASFPRGKPLKRQQTPWGSVAFFESETFKAAVVVSKKVFKKAHDRNKMRRRMYAALSQITPTPQGGAVVLYPRREALTADLEVLTKTLQSFFG